MQLTFHSMHIVGHSTQIISSFGLLAHKPFLKWATKEQPLQAQPLQAGLGLDESLNTLSISKIFLSAK